MFNGVQYLEIPTKDLRTDNLNVHCSETTSVLYTPQSRLKESEP